MGSDDQYENKAATDAELAVIGLALLGGKDNPALTAILELTPEDFYLPNTRIIATAIMDMSRRGLPVDSITLSAELDKTGTLRRVGGSSKLADLLMSAPPGMNAAYYADMIRNDAIRRYRHDAATRLAAMTVSPASVEDLDEIEAVHAADLAGCPKPLAYAGEDDLTAHLARSIRYRVDREDDWVIPGLIARLDRVMVTGQEGLAKSTLLRQVGAATAAGLNPWNGARVTDGKRVLILDCENTDQQITNGVRMIGARVERRLYDRDWDRRLVVYSRGEGINLLGRDVPWLRRLVARARPDLFILGPFYKIMRGDPNKDSDVLEVLSVLDDIRIQQNCGVIIEAHSPLAQGGNERPVRPFGSSVQLRWPEIGFGIRPDERPEVQEDRLISDSRHGRATYMQCVSWRGQREARDWPTAIRYGEPTQLPWVPTADTWKPSVDLGYSEQPALGEVS